MFLKFKSEGSQTCRSSWSKGLGETSVLTGLSFLQDVSVVVFGREKLLLLR